MYNMIIIPIILTSLAILVVNSNTSFNSFFDISVLIVKQQYLYIYIYDNDTNTTNNDDINTNTNNDNNDHNATVCVELL